MTFNGILNGIPLYLAVMIVLIFIIGLAFAFFKKSWNRAIELGYSSKTLKKVIKSSIIFSIVPSLAIVVALFSLASVLGIPWSWFRLSVVGSLAYELMAAEMTVTGAGYNSLSHFIRSGDISAISTIMYVMSFAIIGGIIFNMIFGKKIQISMHRYQNKNADWGKLAMSYFMVCIAVVFIPIQVMEGPVHLMTLLTSALIAYIHLVVIRRFRINWLNEFVLANSLIFGMVSSVLWSQLLG